MQFFIPVGIVVLLLIIKKMVKKFFQKKPKKISNKEEESECKKTLLDYKNIEKRKFDAIVIGSGMSGLASAGYLSKGLKKKVIVLEAHPEKVGGNTHVWNKDGFSFSSGLHFLYGNTPKEITSILFSFLSDGEIKYKVEKDPHFVLFDRNEENKKYEIPFDSKKQEEKYIELFPEEENGIKEFYKYTKETKEKMANWLKLKVFPTFIIRVLVYFGFGKRIIKSLNTETLQTVLNRFIKNKKLQVLLSTHLAYAGMTSSEIPFPLYALTFCTLTKRSFPTEGASMISRKVVKVIKNHGGICVCNAKVERIITRKTKKGKEKAIGVVVKKPNGDKIKLFAKIIISSAGVENTFTKLLPKKSQLNYPPLLKAKLNHIQQEDTMFAFTAFLGFDNEDGKLELKSNQEIFFKDLSLSSSEAKKKLDTQIKFNIKKFKPTLAMFPCLYNKEKKNVGATLFIFVNRKWFDQYEPSVVQKRGKEYEELKEKLLDYGLNVFFEQYPKLEEKLKFVSTATPLTNNSWCFTPRGSFYGHKLKPERSITMKPWVTHIENLYLTGQDTLFAGVGSQLVSALFAVSSVIENNFFSTLFGLKSK